MRLNMKLNDKRGFCPAALLAPCSPVLRAPHSVQHNGLIKASLHACSSVYLGLTLALTAPLSDELIRDEVHGLTLHVILELQ